MKIKEDRDTFDELQSVVLYHLMTSIIEHLKEAGLKGKKLRKAAEDIGFAVGAIIDGSADMPHEKGRVLPVLTFAVNDKYKELISSDGGSWLHEYVIGFLDDLLPE